MSLPNNFVIDRSANHCHLTQEHANILIGKDISKMILKPLAIKGEYATNFKVFDTISGNGYTIMYPFRSYSQIEVAMSDYYKLFKKYTTRVSSGDLEGAVKLPVLGGISIPIIVVKAHVHVHTPTDLNEIYNLNFPFELDIKENETTDGLNHIHLDTDQFAAIQ